MRHSRIKEKKKKKMKRSNRVVAYHAHSFSKHIHNGLISQGAWVCQEEIAQHDVEERKRCNDGLCRYKRHGGRRGRDGRKECAKRFGYSVLEDSEARRYPARLTKASVVCLLREGIKTRPGVVRYTRAQDVLEVSCDGTSWFVVFKDTVESCSSVACTGVKFGGRLEYSTYLLYQLPTIRRSSR